MKHLRPSFSDYARRAICATVVLFCALPVRASEYMRRAVKFTPFPGEDVGRLIRDAGAELFMFSSDYPHPEGTDDPIGRFERTFNGITEEAKNKFYCENFQELMASAKAP